MKVNIGVWELGKNNIGNGETVMGIGFPHFIMGKRR